MSDRQSLNVSRDGQSKGAWRFGHLLIAHTLLLKLPPIAFSPFFCPANVPEKPWKYDNTAGLVPLLSKAAPPSELRKRGGNLRAACANHTQCDDFPSQVNVDCNPISFSKLELIFFVSPASFYPILSVGKIKSHQCTERKIRAIVSLQEEGIYLSFMNGTNIFWNTLLKFMSF